MKSISFWLNGGLSTKFIHFSYDISQTNWKWNRDDMARYMIFENRFITFLWAGIQKSFVLNRAASRESLFLAFSEMKPVCVFLYDERYQFSFLICTGSVEVLCRHRSLWSVCPELWVIWAFAGCSSISFPVLLWTARQAMLCLLHFRGQKENVVKQIYGSLHRLSMFLTRHSTLVYKFTCKAAR